MISEIGKRKMCCAWNDVEGEGRKRNKVQENKNKGARDSVLEDVDVSQVESVRVEGSV